MEPNQALQLTDAHVQELTDNFQDSITLFGFLKISWSVDLAIPQVTVTISLSTPFGDKTIGSATINPQNLCAIIGGSFLGFTAKVTICIDIPNKNVTYDAKAGGFGKNFEKSSILFHF